MGDAARPNHLNPRLWAVVALGGMAGAAAREGVTLLVPAIHGVPVAIAAVNISGAFLLGFLYEALTRPGLPGRRATRLKLLLGTGFCGGFTTYSALAVDAVLLGAVGRPGAALLYVAGTVLAGACATWAGIVAGARIGRNPREERA
ncbi:fluoride efflux transporter FluC [Paeniglutamicibacter sp. R2-26]|uniref:fluoride efflux transporter FluC n=1 Tax=Paeniglutamicibacter sp. R2-26 TaxID=3144417 RepID=UPI003EE4EC5F